MSSYKWGYFVGATIAMFWVFWTLIFPARANAKAISAEAHSAYLKSAGVLAILWLLYPVCWGLAVSLARVKVALFADPVLPFPKDGGNVISPDSEMIFYGVLDLLAKPCL